MGYSKIDGGMYIADETLAKIYRAIETNSGVTITDVIAITKVNNTTTSEAIRELRQMGCVKFKWVGGRKVNFATNHRCYYCA